MAPSDPLIPAPYLKRFGSWWLVTLCDRRETPTVSLAISTWATELTVVNGKIQFPMFAGSEFVPMGIPAGHVGEFPSSPEAAVALAALETGARVAQVPELIVPVSTDGPPQAARWHLTLDRQVSLRGARSNDVLTAETFVGPPLVTVRGIHQFIPSPVQPASVPLAWSPGPRVGEMADAYAARMQSEMQRTIAIRRPDTPIQFETATRAGGR